ncbi:transglycosylase SLT domain-containing protein [Caballeronia grimmiae]|uniref:transglycosylase SLT domain-containing protein n=1 Tax=Caballeronia grimmiae TaxID=1071679 RepID=UPI0038B9D4A7
MADSSGKPILTIDVDASKFDELVERYQQFRAQVDAMPQAWAATNAQVHELQSEFEKAANEANRLNAAALNSRTMGESGFLAKFAHNSRDTSKAWREITKEIESSGKHLSGLARMSLSLNGLGKLPGLVGVAGGIFAGLFAGVEKSAGDLANQNKSARALGLQPGEEGAFSTEYERAGGDSGLLGKIADAKADPRQWQSFFAAGITSDEIKSKSVPDLAAEFLEKGGTAFREKGAMFADAVGLTKILDLQGLRLASSYGHQDYEGMHRRYVDDVPRFAQDQKTLDQASDAKAQFDSAWTTVKTEFEKALMQLTPEFVKIAGAVKDAIAQFEASGGVAKAAKKVEDGFNRLWGVIKPVIEFGEKINPLLPTIGKGGDALDDKAIDWGKGLLDGFDKSIGEIGDTLRGKPHAPSSSGKTPKESDFKADPEREALFPALEKQYGMPKGLLRGVWDIESGGGSRHIGKDGKYLGSMQFDEATAKLYGVNRFDERSSIVGGARLLHDRYQRYGSWDAAVASYDGFAGLDKARAKYGDQWRDHIKEFTSSDETPAYLRKLETKEGVTFAKATVNAPSAPTGDFWARALGTLPKTREEEAERQHQRQLELVRAATPRVGYGGGPQSPFNINVNVSTPPGSNTAITAGGLPQ